MSRVIALVPIALLAATWAGGNVAVAEVKCAPEGLQRQELPSWVQMPSADSLKTRGNVGELPAWYTDATITPEQVSQVCTMGLKAAFLNWSSGAYNQAVLDGAKDALENMGIELVAATNYNFDQAQLATDVRNVMALRPNIIFYSGLDPTADRAALQPAVDAGVAVVSFANAPGEWTTNEPNNFVTLISYDTHGNGAVVAREVAKRFPDGAKLGMIYFDAIYKLVNEREEGFVNELAKTNVEIVVRLPMSNPNATQEIMSAMLARNTDLDVIFAPWDLPADGVVAALNASGKKIPVAHIDLGFSGATQIACDTGPTFVMSSQLVYEWGRTGAIAAALHALGEPVPPYIVVPVFAATKDNLKEAWDLGYGGGAPLPNAALKCLGGDPEIARTRTSLNSEAAGGEFNVLNSSSFALELLGIAKVYGAIEVLHGVDLRVRSGSIHALLGANGAGKSTLLKIAVGATAATAGRVLMNGHERRFASPFEARKAGIGMVFQERSLVPDLSTVDNIFLNGEIKRAGLVNVRAELREFRSIFERLGVRISPTALVGQLGIADQQMVEIAKALRLASSVLILDEPTAALTEREVQRLFTVVRQIAKSGVGIIYVSHRLAEVFDLCDEVTVVRDGRVVLSTTVAETNLREIVEATAGGAVQDGQDAAGGKHLGRSSEKREKPPVLEICGLQVGTKLQDISFELRPAEILGVAGLAGSGRSTLLKALFGVIPRQTGKIRVAGRQVNPTSPAQAIRLGLYLIPENRKTEGLVLSHSVGANLVMSILRRLCVGPLVNARRSAHVAHQNIAELRIQPTDPRRHVEWLSGGNQQKVVLGKAFNAHSRVLLLDEPTFGVDVRSRAEIKTRVRAFADAGNGVIWVTSDVRELKDVSDRILILVDGRVQDIVSNWPQSRAESEITHLIQRSG